MYGASGHGTQWHGAAWPWRVSLNTPGIPGIICHFLQILWGWLWATGCKASTLSLKHPCEADVGRRTSDSGGPTSDVGGRTSDKTRPGQARPGQARPGKPRQAKASQAKSLQNPWFYCVCLHSGHKKWIFLGNYEGFENQEEQPCVPQQWKH